MNGAWRRCPLVAIENISKYAIGAVLRPLSQEEGRTFQGVRLSSVTVVTLENARTNLCRR